MARKACSGVSVSMVATVPEVRKLSCASVPERRQNQAGTPRRMTNAFSFGDRVKIRTNEQTRELGTAGRSGEICGMSREPDVPSGEVVAYAVTMDDERV
jgi:hypothetical protein